MKYMYYSLIPKINLKILWYNKLVFYKSDFIYPLMILSNKKVVHFVHLFQEIIILIYE